VAQENAQRLALNVPRVQFMRSAWFAEIPAQEFDLIVSNPPYIAADDLHLTQGDVRFEPYRALVAEAQGFSDLREIIDTAFHYLVTGGWVLLEHGYTQGAAVRELFHATNYQQIETYQDLAGLDRVTVGRKLA
jgi:release factor glutamine methyltransferase